MQRLSSASLQDSDLGLSTPLDSSSVCSSRTSDSGVSLGIGSGHLPGLRRMQFPRPVQIHHVVPEYKQQQQQQQQHTQRMQMPQQLLLQRPQSLAPSQNSLRLQNQQQQQTYQHQQLQQRVQLQQYQQIQQQQPLQRNQQMQHQQRQHKQLRSPPPPPSYHGNHMLLSNLAELCTASQARMRLAQCNECKQPIESAADACEAMGKVYHSSCFTCSCCGRELIGETFYTVPSVDDSKKKSVYCVQDFLFTGYQQAAEKCTSCGHIITDQILQALGRSYHAACFRCSVCHCCLDGRPFTVDVEGSVLCVTDYHRLYAPRCHKCRLPITPASSDGNGDEVLRVVSMGRDFHLHCYCCQDCGTQLSNDKNQRCYPIVSPNGSCVSLYCYACRLNYS